MYRRWFFICILSFPFVVHAKKFQFIWNPYCPYTCDAQLENGREGVAIDVIKKIFSDTPHQVTFERIDSWLRAKSLVAQGYSDGLAFTFYTEGKSESGYLVQQQPLIMTQGIAYLSLEKHHITPFNISDLMRFTMIGNYQNSVNSDDKLAKFMDDNPNKIAYFTGADILERVVDMLAIGRLEIWLDSPDLLYYFMSKYKGKIPLTVSLSAGKTQEFGGVLLNNTKPNSKILADIMDKGIIKLRKTGELNMILARYGMVDSL